MNFLKYLSAEEKIKKIVSTSSNIVQDVVDFLYEDFDNYNWVGIYFIKGNNLVLGPWKGPHATEHIKIPVGKGICGAAAKSGKTQIVSNVNADNRYLSCFVSTKSEIVVPIIKNNKIIGEIDIDSDKINAFSDKDKDFLEKIADMLAMHI